MAHFRDRKLVLVAALALCLLGVLAGCGGTLSRQAAVTLSDRANESELPLNSPAPTAAPAPNGQAASEVAKPERRADSGTVALLPPGAVAVPDFDRKIIKNGEIALQVRDTGDAFDQITGLATEYRGYVVNSRSWSEGPDRLATITLSVPVDSFEEALRRLRGMAAKVLSEQASGQDFTEEFVDLESRLRNLEATQMRIRGFLDQAVSVQEALDVNAQLSEIEGQIEEVKGKMSYIKGRAAFSNINVSLRTERAAATPTPPATLPAWQPLHTFNEASGSLMILLRTLGDLTIWLGVLLLPFVIPLALLVWAIIAWQRRHRRRAHGARMPDSPEQQPL